MTDTMRPFPWHPMMHALPAPFTPTAEGHALHEIHRRAARKLLDRWATWGAKWMSVRGDEIGVWPTVPEALPAWGLKSDDAVDLLVAVIAMGVRVSGWRGAVESVIGGVE